MRKSIKDLNNIKFPVYLLKSDEWYVRDNVLFIDGLVVDDRNWSGETIGIRRLQSGRKDLYKIKKSYLDLPSMVLSKKRIFIDSSGLPFTYHKTVMAPLKYHKVEQIIPKGSLSVVKLEGLINLFPIPRIPHGDARWARVIYYMNAPWYIFDFARERGKDTRIKI